RLSSWKEIADYLDCDTRTCLRWEKSFGLPIHRLEGAKKSRVYAFRDEIDRWQREKSSLFNVKGAGEDGGRGGGRPGERNNSATGGRQILKRPRNVALVTVAALLVVPAVIFTGLSLSTPRAPAGFRIDGSALVILNAKGKELWRHDAGPHNLARERYRSTKPQERWSGQDGKTVLPHLIIDDLDGDGKVETLFNTWMDDGRTGGNVLCFDQRGKRLWEFETGRPMEFGATRFSGDFIVRGFDAVDLDGDGRKEILVIANQLNRFPTRLSILDTNGELRGDYWHSGHLGDLIAADLDGDGRKEILTFGTNNEYGEGVLIVFDAADVRGCSPQSDERFRWKGVEPGSHLHFIRIPRPDAELADFYPLDDISHVTANTDGRFSVWSGRSGIEYVFDRSMSVVEVRGSHSFQILHENARRSGKITSVADAAYFEDLRRRVLYWDKASASWRALADRSH
ncbi:MAG: VCBS repeat-containing protein, partial [Candidatus Aminicenantes bacterium]